MVQAGFLPSVTKIKGEILMTKIVTVMNFKGGVGKTTITMNLGYALKEQKKVLLIDLDPQFNLSQYLLGYQKYMDIMRKKRPTIYELFEEGAPSIPIRKINEYIINLDKNHNLNLICSRLDLYRTMQTATNACTILKNKLAPILSDYDCILLDCPPTMSIISEAAFYISDYVLIPVMPEYLCTIGLPLLVQSINSFNQKYSNSPVTILGAVINGEDNYSPEGYEAMGDIRKTCKSMKLPLFKTNILYSRSYPKGSRMATSIFETSYARWYTKTNFENFAMEFCQKAGI